MNGAVHPRAQPASRRLAASLALIVGIASLALAVYVVAVEFPRGLILLACWALACAAAWFGLVRRGAPRVAGLTLAVLFVVGALVAQLSDRLIETVVVFVGLAVAVALARFSFRVHVALERAPRPQAPVLFMNPRSGGGKAVRFHLADEARARGIEPIELAPGDDLETLVRRAVESGATALAMAGGDGSQAIVAAIAAELDLPYACVPAGTRNHFALDLGVDRDDVVGALDAFVDGGERRVDLAEVNGRVFVNNVSLGLYANAVGHPEYRDAKLRTLLETVPDVAGPDETGLDLHWKGPDGTPNAAGLVILVSNNRYRLGWKIGAGTRPRLDAAVLGITVVEPPGRRTSRTPRLMREWTAPTFEVASSAAVSAGIDGEAVVLEAPVRFHTRPAALRVRVAPSHPGASPSSAIPDGAWHAIAALIGIAAGRPVSTGSDDQSSPRPISA